MKNYRAQNACQSCKHVFVKYEYDAGDELFCNIDNDRPSPCGSVSMNESFDYMVDKDPNIKIWNKWDKKHKVDAHGVCDKFEKFIYWEKIGDVGA